MYDLWLERLIYRISACRINIEKQKKILWHLFSEGLPFPTNLTTLEITQHRTFLMQPSDCFEQPVWENNFPDIFT